MSTSCPDCGKTYSKQSNVVRHRKTVHEKANLKGTKKAKKEVVCEFCDKTFTRKDTLRLHFRSVHNSQTDLPIQKCDICDYKTAYSANLRKHNKRLLSATSRKRNPKAFSCTLCDAKYAHLSSLKKHKKKEHKEKQTRSIQRKCPLCSFITSGLWKKIIVDHFEQEHSISMTSKMHMFPSIEEFYIWKRDTEKHTKTYFLKVSTKNLSLLMFKCHRSGIYIPKRNRIRRLKSVGSCKINAFCPAYIKAHISSLGCIKVFYQSTHVGHSNDVQFLRLKSEDKKEIVKQLELNGVYRENSESKNLIKNNSTVMANPEKNMKGPANKLIYINNIKCEFETPTITLSQHIVVPPLELRPPFGNNETESEIVLTDNLECPFGDVITAVTLNEEQQTLIGNPSLNTNDSIVSLADEKRKFIEQLTKYVEENVHSFEELQLLRNKCQSIFPLD